MGTWEASRQQEVMKATYSKWNGIIHAMITRNGTWHHLYPMTCIAMSRQCLLQHRHVQPTEFVDRRSQFCSPISTGTWEWWCDCHVNACLQHTIQASCFAMMASHLHADVADSHIFVRTSHGNLSMVVLRCQTICIGEQLQVVPATCACHCCHQSGYCGLLLTFLSTHLAQSIRHSNTNLSQFVNLFTFHQSINLINPINLFINLINLWHLTLISLIWSLISLIFGINLINLVINLH